MRHAASVSIRTEPAGHALLPAAPDTYAPAHGSAARAAARPCRRSRALQYPSGTAGVPTSTRLVQYSAVVYRPPAPRSPRQHPRAPASTPSSTGRRPPPAQPSPRRCRVGCRPRRPGPTRTGYDGGYDAGTMGVPRRYGTGNAAAQGRRPSEGSAASSARRAHRRETSARAWAGRFLRTRKLDRACQSTTAPLLGCAQSTGESASLQYVVRDTPIPERYREYPRVPVSL